MCVSVTFSFMEKISKCWKDIFLIWYELANGQLDICSISRIVPRSSNIENFTDSIIQKKLSLTQISHISTHFYKNKPILTDKQIVTI